MSTGLPLTLINTEYPCQHSKSLSRGDPVNKGERNRLCQEQSSRVYVIFHLLLGVLEMASIKSALDNSDANPQESDYLHCQFPPPFHTPPKFGIYEVREDKERVSGHACFSSYPFFISLETTENFQLINTIWKSKKKNFFLYTKIYGRTTTRLYSPKQSRLK